MLLFEFNIYILHTIYKMFILNNVHIYMHYAGLQDARCMCVCVVVVMPCGGNNIPTNQQRNSSGTMLE